MGDYSSKERKRGGFGLKEGPDSSENSRQNQDEELILKTFRLSILESLKNHYQSSSDSKLILAIRLDTLKFGTNFCCQILSYLKQLIEYNDVTVLCDNTRDLKDFVSLSEAEAKGDKGSQKSEKSQKIEEKIQIYLHQRVKFVLLIDSLR